MELAAVAIPLGFLLWLGFLWVLSGGLERRKAAWRRRREVHSDVRWCRCHHEEWRHVWNSVPLPDGRPSFSTAACSVESCGCLDWEED